MNVNTGPLDSSADKRIPRLKPHFSVIVHDANHIELRSGGFNALSHFLKDEEKTGVLAGILSHLDGRPSREVARAAGVPRTAVEGVIDHLIQIGAVDFSPNSALDAYFDRIAPSLRTREPYLTACMPLTIFGGGKTAAIIAGAVRELLPDATIETLEPDAPLALEIDRLTFGQFDQGLDGSAIKERFAALSGRLLVLPQVPVNPYAALIFNRLALTIGSPWLWGACDGPTLFVGPLTVPGASSCFQCFETRVMMNMRETVSYQRYKSALSEGVVSGAPLPIEAALKHILAGHIAMEAVNYLTTKSAFTIGKSLGLYLPTMEFAFNDVLRLPGCPACGPEPFVDEPELYFDMNAVLRGEHF